MFNCSHNGSVFLKNSNWCDSVAACHALTAITIGLKYIGPPILIFGIISNILTLMTLRQPKLKESPYIHLSGLAMADLGGLFLILLEQQHDTKIRLWLIFRAQIYYPLSNIAATMGVWTMVMMTLERCIFIQFPLWAPIRCTNSNAKIKIFLIFIASCVINFPRFFFYYVTIIYPDTGSNFTANSTRVGTYLIVSYISDTYFAEIITWTWSVLLNFLPVLLLLIFNSFLIYKVRIQHKRRDELGIHNRIETVWSREQTRLTVTLIAIVAVFMILILPSAFAHIKIAVLLFGCRKHEMQIFQHISNFLVWLNLSLNFLMYTFINVKFLRAFKRMMRQWRRRLHLDKLCSWRSRYSTGDARSRSTFPMVETDENIPFNNNMDSLQQLDDKNVVHLNDFDNHHSNMEKENSFTLPLKLDNTSTNGQTT